MGGQQMAEAAAGYPTFITHGRVSVHLDMAYGVRLYDGQAVMPTPAPLPSEGREKMTLSSRNITFIVAGTLVAVVCFVRILHEQRKLCFSRPKTENFELDTPLVLESTSNSA